MTLFISTRTRLYEVSDAYVMALSFLIFFAVGKIVKAVLEKIKIKNGKGEITLPNSRGGSLGVALTDAFDNICH